MPEIIKWDDEEFAQGAERFQTWLWRLMGLWMTKVAEVLRDHFPTAATKNWTYRDGMIDMGNLLDEVLDDLES